MQNKKPLILAPAGSKNSFFAAVAAGADAIYCGLKNFSARMEADNFSISELSKMRLFLSNRGIKLYIALNAILKPSDMDSAFNLLVELKENVKPDALIVSDFAFIEMARIIGFEGEIHLSTLSNLSFAKALKVAQFLNIKKVVLPRELSVDEIKEIAKHCPQSLSLEVFVHGALCYGVSGRCYWSSFLGGKSSLRGRCVQPCRRLYNQTKDRKRFFSCNDLSLDVLAKLLLGIDKVDTWKIEGRKKGANYVYYTVSAYKLLRDNPNNSKTKKLALTYLDMALGRKTTHYNFLSHKRYIPIDTKMDTASGKFIGTIKSNSLITREPLFYDDLIRIGYEDDRKGDLLRIKRYLPKKGRLHIKGRITNNTKVFLIDRKEKELKELISGEIKEFEKTVYVRKKINKLHYILKLPRENVKSKFINISSDEPYFLPPIIWDEVKEKRNIENLIKKGKTFFVLNSPFHIALFERTKNLSLWAGPFCNVTNPLSIKLMSKLGFKGVIVSPELNKKDFLDLSKNSPLPLGVLIYGNFPLTISRTLSSDFKTDKLFRSPKGEEGIVKKKGENYFVYPNWYVDLRSKKEFLKKNGYSLFLTMNEKFPKHFQMKRREGLWNWNMKLL